MERRSGQISTINSLRGIAALAVCFYHFVVTTTDYIETQALLDIFFYGKRGVQLFFIISGIVIPLSMIKSSYRLNLFGPFILRRFVRIEPPYLAAVVIGIVYLYARNFVPSSVAHDMTPSIRDILLHIGYLVPFVEDAKWINPAFWTLSIEFQYYLFLALTFPLAMSPNKIYQYLFAATLILFPYSGIGESFFPGWMSYFGIGIFYTLYLTKTIDLKEFAVMLALTSVSVFQHQGMIDLMIGWVTLAIVHFLPDINSKIGNFFGDISYSLYLLHAVIGAAFINFMSHRLTSPIGKFGNIMAGLAISIGASYLFWKWVERPSQLAARKIKVNGRKNGNQSGK